MKRTENKNLIVFFAATFILTWACYIPIALTGNSPYQMPWMILLILGGAAPSIVGVLMVLLTYEKADRAEYWRRCFSPKRISPLWWVVIFLLFPAIYAVGTGIDLTLGGALPAMEQLKSLISNPIMIPLAAFISFMSGPWSEEFGWRGYALEPMLKRFGILPGTVVLGAIWGLWHLPLFFMPATWHGQMGFKIAGFWMFMLGSIGLALLMTWVYKNTKRSILSGMLMHFASNFTSQLLAPISDRLEILRVLLFFGIGIAACTLISRKGQAKKTEILKKEVPV